MDVNPASEADDDSSPESHESLQHSPTTLHSGVDDKPLARQKRKRTSAEDAAVLEAAYLRDPKPDRASRLQLVERVALGEKEVQIWFQNRRQTSRRKCRPLLPHEIAQYQTSRAAGAMSLLESSSQPPPFAREAPTCVQYDVPFDAAEPSRTDDIACGSQAETEQPSSNLGPNALSCPSGNVEEAHSDSVSHDEASWQRRTSSSTHSLSTSSQPQPLASIGYLSNRRSAPSLGQAASEPPMLTPSGAFAPPERGLRKSSSFIRLALSAEGKAEVVRGDASDPSPPRPPPVLLPELAIVPHRGAALPAVCKLARSSSGRSRDSRSWEFWCDKEARSELGNAAEKDASGSAAGAIGLLRTASGRNILGAIPSKRNSTHSRLTSAAKRLKLDHRRGPVQRSNTSMARLQGQQSNAVQKAPTLKHSGSMTPAYRKGTDSDKENWSPDVQSTPGVQLAMGTLNGSISRMRTADGRRMHTEPAFEEADPEKDKDIAEFMRGGRKDPKVSRDDDLDCVQGLLFLSQGNWR